MKRCVTCCLSIALWLASPSFGAEPATTTAASQPTTDRVERPRLRVSMDRPDWSYAVGGRVRFTVSGPPGKPIAYTIGPEQMPAEPKTAVIPEGGTLEIDGGTMRVPGFLRCIATADGMGRGLATAAFSPEQIRPTQTEPADFDAFWERAKSELAKLPIDARLTPLPQLTNDRIEAFEVNLQTIGVPPATSSRFYGVLCVPRGDGPFPAMLIPPGAGRRGAGANTTWAARGFITLNVGVHEIPVVPTGEFPRVEPPNDYPSSGLESPERYYFRRVFMGCLRANDFLASHPKWDRTNLIAMSGSQGGFLSIVTAALDPRVTLVCASFPAYCDVTGFVHGRAGGWPKFKFDDKGDPQRDAKIATTAYFDCVNFARRLRVPGHYGWGYNDETCSPTSMFSAYNVIAAPKTLDIVKEMGHPRVPELTEAERTWVLAQTGRGEAKE
jgi:cephalosporin-C deacetylase